MTQYLTGFGEILIFLIAGILFVISALTVSKFVRPNRPGVEKLTSYETGEDAVGSAWTQFNVRYYIIALIFLLFEVELVFLFPWAVVFGSKDLNDATQGMWGWFSLIEMIAFIAILSLGLAYAWAKGFLDWIKPRPNPSPYQSGVPKALYDQINEKYK